MPTETSTATNTLPATTQAGVFPNIIGRDASQDYKFGPYGAQGSGAHPGTAHAVVSTRSLQKRRAKHDSKFDSGFDAHNGRSITKSGIVSSK